MVIVYVLHIGIAPWHCPNIVLYQCPEVIPMSCNKGRLGTDIGRAGQCLIGLSGAPLCIQLDASSVLYGHFESQL